MIRDKIQDFKSNEIRREKLLDIIRSSYKEERKFCAYCAYKDVEVGTERAFNMEIGCKLMGQKISAIGSCDLFAYS